MNIRSTTDPMTLQDVINPEAHPCVYDGDGDNGIEVYFMNEENRQAYLNMEIGGKITLQGNSSEDYVAEG